MKLLDYAVQLDDHVAEAGLGFPLFKAGPDKLGWLFNINAVRAVPHRTTSVMQTCYTMLRSMQKF